MQTGGAARVTAILCNGLLELGHEVYLATNTATQSISYPLSKGVNIIPAYKQHGGLFKKASSLLYHLKILRNFCNSIRPDIIIGEQENGALYGYLAKFGLKIPMIGHRHNSFKILGLSPFQKWVFNKAEVTVLLHNEDKKFCANKLNNTCVIYNPCSFKVVPRNNIRKKIVIAVGSINRWHDKGLDIILNVWQSIIKEYGEWKLEIVGNGKKEDEEFIKNMAEELGISDSVEFTGFIYNVDEHLREASIFVLPSRVEGFPMVLNEAISQGCACLAFELDGVLPEIYSNRAVRQVVDGHIDEYAKELAALMSDENMRSSLSSQSQTEIIKYNPENIVKQWDVLIRDILKK